MKNQQKIDVIIIGGGLSGLYLAYLLDKSGINYKIIEASSRLGGRIQTIHGKTGTPLELGATWFSQMHKQVFLLIEELGLDTFEQFSEGKSLFQTKSFEPPQTFFVPASEAPSYRIKGGTSALIEALKSNIDSKSIVLNSKVVDIAEESGQVRVICKNGNTYFGDKVALCIPPQLASRIDFQPHLGHEAETLLPQVQTWMGGSIKLVLEYEKPFWRNNGYSGMLFSHSGIITELYDHSNAEFNKFGFTGFLNSGSASYTRATREALVLEQMVELLGSEAGKPLLYDEKIWTDEFILDGNQVISRPHQLNGHPLLNQAHWRGKLFFAATETNVKFPGYMEGALRSAKRVFAELSKSKT